MKATGMPITRTRSVRLGRAHRAVGVAAEQAKLLDGNRLEERGDDQRTDLRVLEAALDDFLQDRCAAASRAAPDTPGAAV